MMQHHNGRGILKEPGVRKNRVSLPLFQKGIMRHIWILRACFSWFSGPGGLTFPVMFFKDMIESWGEGIFRFIQQVESLSPEAVFKKKMSCRTFNKNLR
jgi:hypothetical protein